MARKWPDHFEKQRLDAEFQLGKAKSRIRQFVGRIPKNLQDHHVKDMLADPIKSTFVDYETTLMLHASIIDTTVDEELQTLAANAYKRICTFAHLFLNHADRISDKLSEHEVLNLIYILRIIDATKIPYDLNKGLRARILVAKLAK